MSAQKLYNILGLSATPQPTPEGTRKAYKEAALKNHPDKNPKDPQATAKFQEINRAYEILISGTVALEDVAEDPFVNRDYQDFNFYEEELNPKGQSPNGRRYRTNLTFEERWEYVNKVLWKDMRNELKREIHALALVKRRIDTYNIKINLSEKRHTKFTLTPEEIEAAEEMIEVYDERCLDLDLDLTNQWVKQSKPELAGVYHEVTSKMTRSDGGTTAKRIHADDQVRSKVTQADVAAEFAAESRNQEYYDHAMPLEYIDKEDLPRVLEARAADAGQDRSLEDADRVDPKRIEAFWENRKGRETMQTISYHTKKERAEDKDTKAEANAYTKTLLLKQEAEIQQAEAETGKHARRRYKKNGSATSDSVESNDNLDRAHFIDDFDNKKILNARSLMRRCKRTANVLARQGYHALPVEQTNELKLSSQNWRGDRAKSKSSAKADTKSNGEVLSYTCARYRIA